MKRISRNIFLFFVLGFSIISEASRARIEVSQSFYDSLSLNSFLLFPTLVVPENTRVLLETGNSAATASSALPGGVLQYSHDQDWTALLSLGLQPQIVATSRELHNQAQATSFKLPQNSFGLIGVKRFAGQSLAIGFNHSEFKDKTNDLFEKSVVGIVAYRWRSLHSTLHWALEDRVNVPGGEELSLRQPFQYSLLYQAEQSEISLQYRSYFQFAELNGSETTSVDQQDFVVGYLDRTLVSMINFSYRIEYLSRTIVDRLADSSERTNEVPVTFLFESKISNQINLMGSVRQPIFYNSNIGNQTQVNVGAELVWDKVILSGTFQGLAGAGSTQKVDGSNLLSRVGLQYTF